MSFDLANPTWSRKAAVENVVPGKHATNGSIVVAVFTGRRDHQRPVKTGAKGKVIETGAANPHSAKNALGTTAALRIAWETPVKEQS